MLSNVRRGEGRGGNLIRVAREGGGGRAGVVWEGWGIKNPSKSKPGAFSRGGLNREGGGCFIRSFYGNK